MRNKKLFYILIPLLAIGILQIPAQGAGTPALPSASSYSLTTSANIFYNWIPVMIVAVFAAAALTAIYYGIGAFLNNRAAKANAINEFYQVLGTVVVIVVILAFFSAYGSAVIASGSLTTAITNICGSNQLGSANTLVNFLNSNTLSSTTTGPTSQICSQVSRSVEGSGITSKIDYGLEATYVIIANLTSQEAVSLNAVNVFETYASTLSSFIPEESICWPETCVLNGKDAVASGFLVYTYRPWSLYDKIRGMTLYVGAEALLSFYISIMQLIVIIVLLFAWPYMLAAGIILRASFFTRKAGGLLIAVVIVAIVLYPLLNLFEYTSLSNIQSSPIGPVASKIPAFTLQGQAPCPTFASLFSGALPAGAAEATGNPAAIGSAAGAVAQSCGTFNPAPVIDYTDTKLNFYVLPRLDYILNYDGCWPPLGNVFVADVLIAGFYSLPGYGEFLALKDLVGSFTGNVPSPPIPWFACNPGNAIKSILDMARFYGMVFVTTVLLPVLNILILLSGVKNISGMLGGDTRILGLGKLV